MWSLRKTRAEGELQIWLRQDLLDHCKLRKSFSLYIDKYHNSPNLHHTMFHQLWKMYHLYHLHHPFHDTSDHVDGSTHLQSPQSTRPGRLQLPSCRCNGFVWLNLLSDPTVTVTHRTLRHETIETTFMARNATGSAFPVPKPAKLELWVGCKWLEVRILLLKHVS